MMSFKIVFFAAAAVLASQASAQLSVVRPFVTGFSNGFSEMAKPFLQLAPATDYFRPRPQVAQWVSYPGQPGNIVPQGPPPGYEGFEMPGASFIQVIRPRPLRPQFFPAPQPGPIVPSRPYPIPAPAPVPAPSPSSSSSSSSEEDSDETYVPSNLLIEQPESPVKLPEPAEAKPEVEIPSLQRPLPLVEDEQ